MYHMLRWFSTEEILCMKLFWGLVAPLARLVEEGNFYILKIFVEN